MGGVQKCVNIMHKLTLASPMKSWRKGLEKVHIQLCINLPTHSRRGVSAGGRNEKYALTYSFSLEDDLQVENQRERERDSYSSNGGVRHS